ncbi:MAG: DUF3667 domain-containing protein [Kordiimonadaceae bacterium]|nr:DUF3667 domain-containing protein [Kordiimonadaceae bacterium]MBO6569069.1 DUF3667 domain-containing protein [Kordiimonadaceae bacterium]MBO6964544.1 DUF3667 domain-containing protein [Kordiimonadaceae bacterium]
MLRYFRKWSIALRRRRLKKERSQLAHYATIERGVRDGGDTCFNCGAPLTGPFCHICGQRADDLQRPIWTFFKELLDAIFDTDSKIIKTILALIFVPGGLSRDFMDGKRARYLPPFRLYIVLLFAFFATLSIADILILDIHVQPKAETVAARQAVEAATEQIREQAEAIREQALEQAAAIERGETSEPLPPIVPEFDEEALERQITEAVEQAERQVESDTNSNQIRGLVRLINNLDYNPAESEAIEDFLDTLTDELEDMEDRGEEPDFFAVRDRAIALLDDPETQLSEQSRNSIRALTNLDPDMLASTVIRPSEEEGGFNIGNLPYDFDIDMFVPNDRQEREGIKQEDLDFILDDPSTPQIVKDATANFTEALQNPREFNNLFNDWLPLALVFLMPVFALILSLTHWGRNRYYLNQLVFAIHFHSFLFVFLLVLAFVMPQLEGGPAFGIFWWTTSAYLIIALKVGQKQGWIRAFLKAGFIWCSYFVIMIWTMAAVMFFGISDSTVGEFVEMVQNSEDGPFVEVSTDGDDSAPEGTEN